MNKIICIVSTSEGFRIAQLTGEELEACNNLVATHPTMASAIAGLQRAQQLERKMRPLWQAAIEHEQRVRNAMLDAVYASAKPLAIAPASD